MIASICFLRSDKCILSCDGEKFDIIGVSDTANELREISGRANSFFSVLKKDNGSSFDPVGYWYNSSQQFAVEEPPTEYSDELLKQFEDELNSQSS
jgi:hypothetical protein